MAGRKAIVTAAGIAAIAVGLIWVGQGSGWFPYPRQSFMIDDPTWSLIGGALVLAGVVALAVAWRRG
ncbi:MAG: hypothetical protein U1E56_00150 [Bauldia sp.]